MRAVNQRGLTTVEFAIVGLLLLIVLFGIIEIGRTIYTMAVLQEGARRAARVAAVSSLGCSAAEDAVTSMPIHGIDDPAVEVKVEYLDADENDAGGDYGNVRYVRASIVNYTLTINIPLVAPEFTFLPVVATLPRESLGVERWGEVAQCY